MNDPKNWSSAVEQKWSNAHVTIAFFRLLHYSTTPLLLFLCLICGTTFALDLRVATFKVDVTPPPGSPLCDGLVPPATGVDDPLSARGIILQADKQKPVVLVAFDWVGIGNSGQDAFREAIAEAVKTPTGRVCVHALHQHDAPGCDFLAEKIAAEAGLPNRLFPVDYSRDAIRRVAAAAAGAQSHLERVTHVGYGKGIVEKVASNRRILGPNGKVKFERMSACKDPAGQALPEGLIDPNVRMLTFWNDDHPLAVLTYYATHPQSYYYTGKCSADFVGMGRDEAEAAEKPGLHIHFNGAGGNIAAGKYNDGSHAMRPILAQRLADGMKRAWDDTKKVAAGDLTFDWATRDVLLPVGEWYDEKEQLATLHNDKEKLIPRLRAARNIAWARRATDGHKITIARLRLGPDRYPANARRALRRIPARRPKDAPGLVRLSWPPMATTARATSARPTPIRKAATKPVLVRPCPECRRAWKRC